ncbi:glycoside hydrolase family 2 protein [Winogradskyella sp.]|uniref:glycoside hydrolase family 2 protein n=1 Tax=Winogradskyella sp. TaxID=1883156 RepID=UPI002623FAAF|nr:glycoside hydrolase family 2 TIM barrel-domain containing protein [Winogradskyella sp.]
MKKILKFRLKSKLTQINLLNIMLWLFVLNLNAQSTPLIQNIYSRDATSLNGHWKFVADPYETGYRNHRNWQPFDKVESTKASAKPYWTDRVAESPTDRVEYNFNTSDEILVPGDWNTQKPELFYYEGSAWYRTTFDYDLPSNKRLILYFGGANYQTDVYLNGQKVGMHLGGYDPFNFDITELVLPKRNSLVVRVDNRRENNRVPGLTSDWWNYGGLTREVKLVELPETYIQDYMIQLDPKSPENIKGFIKLNVNEIGQKINVSIPEIKLEIQLVTNAEGIAELSIPAKKIKKWYPQRPKLYDIKISASADVITDRIGFRTIETKGADILLNGQSIFLRGISLHEENPIRGGRAYSNEDAKTLFGWAEELNCNFVRLAHYPHNEYMPRLADELGILLWEEIPVYWGIDYENPEVFNQAKTQLETLIQRDKNRASVIIWSLANETPEVPSRLNFLKKLKAIALEIDDTRFISAALERDEKSKADVITIPDPFAEDVDIIACNEYIGWYSGLPDRCDEVSWELPNNKPFFVSEFGGGALYNHRGDKLERWTEDYQKYLYEKQIAMLKRIPTLRGSTPWILVDFRSPRRNLPLIQDGWNRKGLISDGGFKKEAYWVLKSFYDEMEAQYQIKIKN